MAKFLPKLLNCVWCAFATVVLVLIGIYWLTSSNHTKSQPAPVIRQEAVSVEQTNAVPKAPGQIPAVDSLLPEQESEESIVTQESSICDYPKQPSFFDYNIAFTSIPVTDQVHELSIEGTIPEWLLGVFYSVGPGLFEIGDQKASSWLDGCAIVHKFTFSPHAIAYEHAVVESDYYKKSVEQDALIGSKPKKRSFFSKLLSRADARYDNANVNVIPDHNCLLALTETPHMTCIDTHDLSSKPYKYTDNRDDHYMCVHPYYDAATQEWITYGVTFGHTSTYTIYALDVHTGNRRNIASIPVARPSYMHSFALTDHYIILMHMPFTVSPYDLLTSNNAFIENFVWDKKGKTEFLIINRQTGHLQATCYGPALFALHHINAFEDNNTICIDIAAYDNPAIVKTFDMNKLTSCCANFVSGTPTRCVIDMTDHNVQCMPLASCNLEFPSINKHYRTGQYRYMYGISMLRTDMPATVITKIDMQSGHNSGWQEQGCLVTEPVFVACPTGKAEDDGVLISLVLDTIKQQSFIAIFDAHTLQLCARAYVPHHIPLTVHSCFSMSQNNQNQ